MYICRRLAPYIQASQGKFLFFGIVARLKHHGALPCSVRLLQVYDMVHSPAPGPWRLGVLRSMLGLVGRLVGGAEASKECIYHNALGDGARATKEVKAGTTCSHILREFLLLKHS